MCCVVSVISFTGLLLITSCANIGRLIKQAAMRGIIGSTNRPTIVFFTQLASAEAGILGLKWTKVSAQTAVKFGAFSCTILKVIYKNAVQFYLS